MVHLIYTYLTLFSVLVSYLYKLDNIQRRKIQKRLEKSQPQLRISQMQRAASKYVTHSSTRAHVGGRRSCLVAAHFALYQCQKRSGSRPVISPSRFANFNCFNSKTSVYFYYKIFVFQTTIVKGRNRNRYEYKNCITDPYSVK